MADRPQCESFKADESRCRAPALPGSVYCWFHDPARAAERAAARRKGGESCRRAPVRAPADEADLPLATVADVVALLGKTINDVRKGKLDVKPGNAVGYLASVLLRALEVGQLEERLAALEGRMGDDDE